MGLIGNVLYVEEKIGFIKLLMNGSRIFVYIGGILLYEIVIYNKIIYLIDKSIKIMM